MTNITSEFTVNRLASFGVLGVALHVAERFSGFKDNRWH